MPHRTRNSRCAAVALAVTLAAFAPATAGAAITSQGSLQAQAGSVSVSLGASVGQIEGTATERVFHYPFGGGEKVMLSELTWDLTEVLMAGVQGSVGFAGRFHLNLGYWTALTEGNAEMVDRDWLYAPEFLALIDPNANNWTHQSKHPDTTLDRGTMLDVNLAGRFWEAGPFSASAIVGYKQDDWKWSARGGSYIYSDEALRDTVGSFPSGQEVIAYEQEYSIPYLGLGAAWSGATFGLEARVLLSNWVSATDTDDHVLRSTLFEGDFSDGEFVGVGLGATWSFAERWFAKAALDYQKIAEITGDVTMRAPQGAAVFRDGGGVSQESLLLSAGVGFAF